MSTYDFLVEQRATWDDCDVDGVDPADVFIRIPLADTDKLIAVLAELKKKCEGAIVASSSFSREIIEWVQLYLKSVLRPVMEDEDAWHSKSRER